MQSIGINQPTPHSGLNIQAAMPRNAKGKGSKTMQFNLTTTESKRDRMNRLHIDALSALVQWAAMATDESDLVERIETVNKRMTAQNYQQVRDQFDTAARDAYAAQNGDLLADSMESGDDTPDTDSAPSEDVEKPARPRKASGDAESAQPKAA